MPRAANKGTRISRRWYKLAAFGLLVGCTGYAGGQDGEGAGVNGHGEPGDGSGFGNSLGGVTQCWYSEESGMLPAATLEYVFEVVDGQSQLHVRLTFALPFVDNTYGANAIGWGKRGHSFHDLLRSDHAEIILSDGNGSSRMQFKMDYISDHADAPSGYATLGIWGGDGEMIAGDAAHVLDVMTSLDNNLNALGYSSYVIDSPPTDADYTPSAEAPAWDYRVSYDAWIDEAAFGSAGFGDVLLEYVHASPSRSSNDTWKVWRDDCPPGWTPGGNDTGAGGGPGSGSGGSDSGAGGYTTSGGNDSGAGGYTTSGAGGTDSGAGGNTSGSGGKDSGAGGSGGFTIPTGSGGSNDSGAVGSGGNDSGAGGGPTNCDVQACLVTADCPTGYGCYSGCCYQIPK